MKRVLVLCTASLLACSSAAMGAFGYGAEQERLTLSRTFQQAPNGFLGVELGDVNKEIVQRLKLREERGALIEGVTSGSSAAQAGLQKDDVIVKWDGDPIESARELSRHIRETPAGRTVRLGVIRDGREIEVQVKLGERRALTRPRIVGVAPEARAAMLADAARAREQTRSAAARAREDARAAVARAREQARDAAALVREQARATGRLGVQLQSMTNQLAEYFGLSKRTGALIVFVYADTPAAKAGLKAGDVILSAAGQTVETPMDLRRVLSDKPEGALELRILREKREQNLTVQVERRSGSLLLDGDCVDSLVHAAIAPVEISIPKVSLATIRVQVPKVSLTPMKIEIPDLKIAPISIPEVKVDLAPLEVTVPRIKLDPVKVVVVPKRVVL